MKGKFPRTWAVGADHLPLELEGRNLDIWAWGLKQSGADGKWGSMWLKGFGVLKYFIQFSSLAWSEKSLVKYPYREKMHIFNVQRTD